MQCKAVQVVAPNKWLYADTEVNDLESGVIAEVKYSSICGTDRDVINGTLIYYRDGSAKYPIITGHEWCGIYEGQPVAGICIIGCGHCKKCFQNKPMHCDERKEVGVVNKNGGHAEYIAVKEEWLVPIPTIDPKYSLVEPLAVCVHALGRVSVSSSTRILISGYGCIGKLCGYMLKTMGYHFEIYDPRYTPMPEFRDFDLIMECSGERESLKPYVPKRGVTILVFGFDYEDVNPSLLSANEMSLVGTLGSNKADFERAVEIMDVIEPDFFEILPLSSFGVGVKKSLGGQKIVFDNRR